jgi:hypothetical protein
MIERTSFEANDTAIWCISAGVSVVSGIGIQGQPYAASRRAAWGCKLSLRTQDRRVARPSCVDAVRSPLFRHSRHLCRNASADCVHRVCAEVGALVAALRGGCLLIVDN